MLSRTTQVRHPQSGVSLRTPLLIPSFSSKGFPSTHRDGSSELQTVLYASAEFLTDVFLVSAYDIAHSHLPSPIDFPCKPELVFVDSGGYEISTSSDYSTVTHHPTQSEPWTIDRLRSVFDRWPAEIPAVFVSFDHPKERHQFIEQVAMARKLFREHPHQLTLLLLKPETLDQNTLAETIRTSVANAEQLRGFDIVGVTEKELGHTMIGRMCEITKLRLAMDEAEIRAPLHIFGALDPVAVCLYFIAGAEIFDGLTWLRYAYNDDICVYKHNVAALNFGLTTSDDIVQSRVLSENLYALEDLRERMSVFVSTGNFDDFGTHAEMLKKAAKSLRSRFPGRF